MEDINCADMESWIDSEDELKDELQDEPDESNKEEDSSKEDFDDEDEEDLDDHLIQTIVSSASYEHIPHLYVLVVNTRDDNKKGIIVQTILKLMTEEFFRIFFDSLPQKLSIPLIDQIKKSIQNDDSRFFARIKHPLCQLTCSRKKFNGQIAYEVERIADIFAQTFMLNDSVDVLTNIETWFDIFGGWLVNTCRDGIDCPHCCQVLKNGKITNTLENSVDKYSEFIWNCTDE